MTAIFIIWGLMMFSTIATLVQAFRDYRDYKYKEEMERYIYALIREEIAFDPLNILLQLWNDERTPSINWAKSTLVDSAGMKSIYPLDISSPGEPVINFDTHRKQQWADLNWHTNKLFTPPEVPAEARPIKKELLESAITFDYMKQVFQDLNNKLNRNMNIETAEYGVLFTEEAIFIPWEPEFWQTKDAYVKLMVDRDIEICEAYFTVEELKNYVIESFKIENTSQFPKYMVDLVSSNLVNNLYLEYLINKWQ